MRQIALLIMLLMLVACTPATAPPVPSTEPSPPPSSIEAPSQPSPEKQQAPSTPHLKEPEPMRLEFHVSPQKAGPWTPYFPGIHLVGTEIWVRIEANQPLPQNALERFTSQVTYTPGIQGESLSDRVLLLWRAGPAIRFSPTVILPKDAKLPDILALTGSPPQIREWDPASGKTRTLASLRDLPSTHTLVKLEPDNQTLTYSALLQEKAVEISFKTGESRSVPQPAWPGRGPEGRPYRLALSPGAHLAPNSSYSAQVIKGGGESGKVVLDLPNLQTITPFNPCLPFDSYHAWSPDGTRLVLATMASEKEVALLIADVRKGTTETLLTRPSDHGLESEVNWSPDGRWIVFHDVLVEVATAQIAANPVGRVSYWRPDGRYLAAADEGLFRGWGALRVIEPGQEKAHLEANGRFITWTDEARLLYFEWANGQQLPIGPRDCN